MEILVSAACMKLHLCSWGKNTMYNPTRIPKQYTPIFIVLQIKPPDVCHTQRIRNIMRHLTFLWFKHVCTCIHKESYVYISMKGFLKIAYFQCTLFFPLRLLGKGNISLLHSPFLDIWQFWMIELQKDRLSNLHVNKNHLSLQFWMKYQRQI